MLLFIVSLLVLVGSIFAAIAIIGYVAAGISCVSDVVNETEIEAKDEVGIHPDGDDVNDVIELYEEVNEDEGLYSTRDY